MSKQFLNAVIMLLAVLAITASYTQPGWVFYLLKPATTISIILLPLVFDSQLPADISPHRPIIIVALVFCLLGDVFLLNSGHFIFGIGAFLVAHLIFAFVFYTLADKRVHLTPLLVLLLLGIAYYSVLLPHLDNFVVPVAAYLLCITLMTWQGIRVGLSRRDVWGWRIAIAGSLFVLSDSLIAMNKFIQPFSAANALILGLYWLSIGVIAHSFSGSPATQK